MFTIDTLSISAWGRCSKYLLLAAGVQLGSLCIQLEKWRHAFIYYAQTSAVKFLFRNKI